MSWGISGFRIGVSANGRKYLTIGIPRTGIYFTKYFNQQPTQKQTATQQQFQQSNSQQTVNEKEEPWWKQKNL